MRSNIILFLNFKGELASQARSFLSRKPYRVVKVLLSPKYRGVTPYYRNLILKLYYRYGNQKEQDNEDGCIYHFSNQSLIYYDKIKKLY